MRNVISCPRYWLKIPPPIAAKIFDQWPQAEKDFYNAISMRLGDAGGHFVDCNCRCTNFVFNGTRCDAGTMCGYLPGDVETLAPETLYLLPAKLPTFCYPAKVIAIVTTTYTWWLIRLSVFKQIPFVWPLDSVWDAHQTQEAGKRHNLFSMRATRSDVITFDPANSTGKNWQLYHWLYDASSSYDILPRRQEGDILLPIVGTPLLLYQCQVRGEKIHNPRISMTAAEFFMATYIGCPNPPSPNPLHFVELSAVRYCDLRLELKGPGWQNPNRGCCLTEPDSPYCCQTLAEFASDGDGLVGWFPWESGTIDGTNHFLIGIITIADKWKITITGDPTGGSYILTWAGHDTASLAWNAPASAVQTALRAIAGLETVTVTSEGTSPNWIHTAHRNAIVGDLTATSSLTGGTPGIAITVPPQMTINSWPTLGDRGAETFKKDAGLVTVIWPVGTRGGFLPLQIGVGEPNILPDYDVLLASFGAGVGFGCPTAPTLKIGDPDLTIAFYYQWPTHYWPECDPQGVYIPNRELSDGTVIEHNFSTPSTFKECIDEDNYKNGFFFLLDNFGLALQSYGVVAAVASDGKSCTISPINLGLYKGDSFNYPAETYFNIRWGDLGGTYDNQEVMWDDLPYGRYFVTGGADDGSTFSVHLDLADYYLPSGERISKTFDYSNPSDRHDYEHDDPLNVFPPVDTQVMIVPMIAMYPTTDNSFLGTKRTLQSTGKLRGLHIPLKNFQVDYSLFVRGARAGKPFPESGDQPGQTLIFDYGGGGVDEIPIYDEPICPVYFVNYSRPGLYSQYDFESDPPAQSVSSCFWTPTGSTTIIRETLVNGIYARTPLAIKPPKRNYGIDYEIDDGEGDADDDEPGIPRPPYIASGVEVVDSQNVLTPFQLREMRVKYVEGGFRIDQVHPVGDEADVHPIFVPDRRMRFYGTATGGTYTLTYQRPGCDIHANTFAYDATAGDIGTWLAGLNAITETDGFPAFVAGDIVVSEFSSHGQRAIDFKIGGRFGPQREMRLPVLPIALETNLVGTPALTVDLDYVDPPLHDLTVTSSLMDPGSITITSTLEWQIEIYGTPTGGYYTLMWNDVTTDHLAFDATGADVQAALRLIVGLEAVTVTTTGDSPNFTHTIPRPDVPFLSLKFGCGEGCNLTHQFIQGTFSLSNSGQTTGLIPYNAENQAIINAMTAAFVYLPGFTGITITEGNLPYGVLKIETDTAGTLLSDMTAASAPTSAFCAFEVYFENASLPENACGTCPTYCGYCYQDVPAGAMKIAITVKSGLDVTIKIFPGPFFSEGGCAIFSGEEVGTWNLIIKGNSQSVDFCINYDIHANDAFIAALQSWLDANYPGATAYGAAYAGYVYQLYSGVMLYGISFPASCGLNPDDITVTPGTNCSRAVLLTCYPSHPSGCSSSLGGGCLSTDFVLWHQGLAPTQGCIYANPSYRHPYVVDNFPDSRIEIVRDVDGSLHQIPDPDNPGFFINSAPGFYVDLKIYDCSNGQAVRWWKKVGELGDNLRCTNFNFTLGSTDYHFYPDFLSPMEYNWPNAIIQVSSIEYPGEYDPIGGKEIASYFNRDAARTDWNCRQNCGKIPEEIHAVLSGGIQGWPVTGMVLKHSMNSFYHGDPIAHYWSIVFDSPLSWTPPGSTESMNLLGFYAVLGDGGPINGDAVIGAGYGVATFWRDSDDGRDPRIPLFVNKVVNVINSATGCITAVLDFTLCLGVYTEVTNDGFDWANENSGTCTLSASE